MMRNNRLLLFLVLVACAAASHADVYKSTGPAGITLFSDRPSKGAAKLDIPPPPPPLTAPAASEESAEPEKKPSHEDAVDETRKALQGKLDAETGALAAAKAELKKAQAIILGTERNSQADFDRTAALEDEIARHEKAVESLRKQISNLK